MLQRIWRKGNLLTLLVENSVEIPQKPRIELPCNPAISLLGINPKETRTERDTSTPVFTAALFTIAKPWKQPRCPLADEWIRKLQYIYTMEYYSAIKRSTFESVLMRWMNLEPIIQSEVSQKEKDKYHILTHIYIYGIQKNGTEKFIYRATVEKQTERVDLWTWGKGRRG